MRVCGIGRSAVSSIVLSTQWSVAGAQVFGFGDDVFINITDIGGGKCKVEYQGQLRLGGSDLGVNYNRGKSLVDTLKASS